VTALDIAALLVMLLSVLFAWARGIIRSLIGTVAWIVGFVVAIGFAPTVGTMLPDTPNAPWLRYVIAFVGIFLAAILAGALIAWPLRAVVRKAGLGFVDATLGRDVRPRARACAHGRVRARAGATGLAQREWWQNAYLAPTLASAALSLRPWLPHDWAERLDFSAAGTAPVAPAPPKTT
jgi:membrane protein required for colicin V production